MAIEITDSDGWPLDQARATALRRVAQQAGINLDKADMASPEVVRVLDQERQEQEQARQERIREVEQQVRDVALQRQVRRAEQKTAQQNQQQDQFGQAARQSSRGQSQQSPKSKQPPQSFAPPEPPDPSEQPKQHSAKQSFAKPTEQAKEQITGLTADMQRARERSRDELTRLPDLARQFREQFARGLDDIREEVKKGGSTFASALQREVGQLKDLREEGGEDKRWSVEKFDRFRGEIARLRNAYALEKERAEADLERAQRAYEEDVTQFQQMKAQFKQDMEKWKEAKKKLKKGEKEPDLPAAPMDTTDSSKVEEAKKRLKHAEDEGDSLKGLDQWARGMRGKKQEADDKEEADKWKKRAGLVQEGGQMSQLAINTAGRAASGGGFGAVIEGATQGGMHMLGKLGQAGGPLGAAVAGIGAAVGVFGAAVASFKMSVDYFSGRADALQRFNGNIAGAKAEQKVIDLMDDLRESQYLGSELAELTRQQTSIESEIRELLLPFKKEVLQGINDLLSDWKQFIQDFGPELREGMRTLGMILKLMMNNGILDALHGIMKQMGLAADEAKADSMAGDAANNFTASLFQRAFNDEGMALPVPRGVKPGQIGGGEKKNQREAIPWAPGLLGAAALLL